MRRWLFALMLAMCLSSAYAEIPLVLEATIQLPSAGGWDVQHWMSDSTFGWACVSGSAVYYCLNIGDSVRAFVPNPLLHMPEIYADFTVAPQAVRLLRLGIAPDHAFLLIQCMGTARQDEGFAVDGIVFYLEDLTTNELVGSFRDWYQSNRSYEGGPQTSCHGSYPYIIPWPAPPSQSTLLSFALDIACDGYTHGGDYWTGGFGRIHYVDLESAPSDTHYVTHGQALSPFVRSNPLRMALSGSNVDAYNNSYWANTFRPGVDIGTEQDTTQRVTAVAQQDSDGTERLITQSGAEIRAVNPDDYSLMWTVTVPALMVGTMQFAGSGDERLLTRGWAWNDTLRVWDASNGVLIGTTTPVVGSIQYIIKPPNRAGEIVTLHDGIVRIYDSRLTAPSGLTCYFIPESNVVRLRWQAVEGAEGYKVYAASSADGEHVLVTELPAGTLSYDLAPQEERQFFYVTAVYAAR